MIFYFVTNHFIPERQLNKMRHFYKTRRLLRDPNIAAVKSKPYKMIIG